MIIYKALLKYGYSNFKLEISFFLNRVNFRRKFNPENLIDREQHYLNLLKPEYNVLKDAGSSLGFKHSEESLAKVRSHLSKLNFEKGLKIEVTDTKTNTFTSYESVRKAAKALNRKSTIF
uniref:GIY-YIG endonuclease family protein n=1 Tax=Rhizoctonia solani TaxID=456999 RepID=N0D8I6_9AGAM|nr:GIY-YIG endonuclease family protein [Rhizoctonia solani]AGK92818.1 GIY-YIG endonuclease family protein [Rhizoctonia solani]